MDFTPTEEQEGIRKAIRELCKDFADPYWRELDKTNAYPEAFVKALTEAGWLAMLIPEQYGGSGLVLADPREAVGKGQIVIQPLDLMFSHHTTQLFITDLEVPAENLIGREGEGFRHIIDGWNAERVLVSSQSVGDGHWFVEKATA